MSARNVTIALRPTDDGSLDDVVVSPVRMFRAEMMDEGELWMACYVGSSTDQATWDEVTFSVRAVKRGVLEFTVTDAPHDARFEAGSILAPSAGEAILS